MNKSNSPASQTFQVDKQTELLTFLIEHLPRLSRNAVKSILGRGEVQVNGKTVTAFNAPLLPGHTVTILGKGRLAAQTALTGVSILFEDDDIVVIRKEAGLLTIASPHENEMTAYRQLSAHVRRANPKNRIFIVHRLDRDTSGVMMFAKSEKMQQLLQNSWQDTVRERTYIALVEGMVKQTNGTIQSWLKENKALKMYSSRHPNDGQLAITHYKTVRAEHGFSLLEVQLETGRKNQIRAHLQDIGHPVVGDKKYGARTNPIGRIGLHANVLAFIHPRTGKLMRFEADMPKTFVRPFQQG